MFTMLRTFQPSTSCALHRTRYCTYSLFYLIINCCPWQSVSYEELLLSCWWSALACMQGPLESLKFHFLGGKIFPNQLVMCIDLFSVHPDCNKQNYEVLRCRQSLCSGRYNLGMCWSQEVFDMFFCWASAAMPSIRIINAMQMQSQEHIRSYSQITLGMDASMTTD